MCQLGLSAMGTSIRQCATISHRPQLYQGATAISPAVCGGHRLSSVRMACKWRQQSGNLGCAVKAPADVGRRSPFMVDATLERVLKRDRVTTVLGLGAIATLAWLYTIFVASMVGGDMAGAASHVTMPRVDPWSGVDFLLMFAMWAVMMVAMMLPSASSVILLFAKVNRARQQAQAPYLPTSLFAGSYVIVWAGFALMATAANWAL